MTNLEKIGVVSIGVTVLSIGYSSHIHRKVNKIYELIKIRVDDISKEVKVELGDDLIEAAVERAVNREVEKAARKATCNVVDTMRNDIRRDVSTAINSSYDEIKSDVKKEVVKQIGLIDIRRLKEEVKQEAKEDVIEKFNGDLDSLLDDFNKNLANISKIYSSIAESISKRDSGTILRIE